MKIMKSFLIATLGSLSVFAQIDTPKQTIQSNYMLNYNTLPAPVESFSDGGSEGILYGRLRTNWFFFKY